MIILNIFLLLDYLFFEISSNFLFCFRQCQKHLNMPVGCVYMKHLNMPVGCVYMKHLNMTAGCVHMKHLNMTAGCVYMKHLNMPVCCVYTKHLNMTAGCVYMKHLNMTAGCVYTLSNKNPSAWNFLSPELEVTWCTAAIIIRVVLLSPYLCIHGVSLSSIHGWKRRVGNYESWKLTWIEWRPNPSTVLFLVSRRNPGSWIRASISLRK
jgi:hypothetical protein